MGRDDHGSGAVPADDKRVAPAGGLARRKESLRATHVHVVGVPAHVHDGDASRARSFSQRATSPPVPIRAEHVVLDEPLEGAAACTVASPGPRDSRSIEPASRRSRLTARTGCRQSSWSFLSVLSRNEKPPLAERFAGAGESSLLDTNPVRPAARLCLPSGRRRPHRYR